MDLKVIHNEENNRFETHIDEYTAFVDYIKSTDKCLSVIHTKVPRDLEGHGIAGVLTRAVLDYARDNNFSVKPVCPYTAIYIQRHPEYADLTDR